MNMADKVPLFYLSKCLYGGWRIYTCHLYEALKAVGLEPIIIKVANTTERSMRDFRYGYEYRNMSPEDAIAYAQRIQAGLIVAFDKNTDDLFIELHSAGMTAVMHDEDEFSTKKLKEYLVPRITNGERVITVRKNSLSKMGARAIPHPYKRGMEHLDVDWDYVKGKLSKKFVGPLAVSTTRIDNDKRTEYLFLANRILKKSGAEITIYGFDGRVYGRKYLSLEFPEYVPSGYTFGHETVYEGAKLCQPARYAVDMSRITGDGGGGGTQYTFLEAMDAGTPIIIHRDWLRSYGSMKEGQNCYAIESPEELAEYILRDRTGATKAQEYYNIVQSGFRLLKTKHSPRVVGAQYKEALGL